MKGVHGWTQVNFPAVTNQYRRRLFPFITVTTAMPTSALSKCSIPPRPLFLIWEGEERGAYHSLNCHPCFLTLQMDIFSLFTFSPKPFNLFLLLEPWQCTKWQPDIFVFNFPPISCQTVLFLLLLCAFFNNVSILARIWILLFVLRGYIDNVVQIRI